jgi:hypothetical protein
MLETIYTDAATFGRSYSTYLLESSYSHGGCLQRIEVVRRVSSLHLEHPMRPFAPVSRTLRPCFSALTQEKRRFRCVRSRGPASVARSRISPPATPGHLWGGGRIPECACPSRKWTTASRRGLGGRRHCCERRPITAARRNGSVWPPGGRTCRGGTVLARVQARTRTGAREFACPCFLLRPVNDRVKDSQQALPPTRQLDRGLFAVGIVADDGQRLALGKVRHFQPALPATAIQSNVSARKPE